MGDYDIADSIHEIRLQLVSTHLIGTLNQI